MIAHLCVNRGEFLTNCVEIYTCRQLSAATPPPGRVDATSKHQTFIAKKTNSIKIRQLRTM